MGSGVFDFDGKHGKGRPDPGVHRLPRAERRRGRETAGRARSRESQRDRVSDGPGGSAHPAGGPPGARFPPGDPDVALARGGRRLQRVRRGVRAARRRGVCLGCQGRRRARARPARGPVALCRSRARHRVASLAVRPAGGLEGEGLGDARGGRARRQARGGSRRPPRKPPARAAAAKPGRARRRDLPDGADERAWPGALGALRMRPRLRTRRARDGGGADSDRRPARHLRGRSSPGDRGALRCRGRKHGAFAFAVDPQRHLPLRGTCRISTCRSRSRTSNARCPG